MLTHMTKTRNREPIVFTITGDRAVVTGDAFIHKQELKDADFRWDFHAKHWHGPAAAVPTIQVPNAAPLLLDPRDVHPRITFTINYDGFELHLPATPNQIEMLYRHVLEGTKR